MDDDETVLAILRQLKGLGARLAIDDFGQSCYFGKPMASEEITRLLRDDAPARARKPATTG